VIGTEVNGEWFDRALILCASLMAVGAITSAIGIRNTTADESATPPATAEASTDDR